MDLYTVTELPANPKGYYKCDECGCENIELKHWARWDRELQAWIITEDCEEGYAYCPSCEGDVSFDWAEE
jgi:hypothetical protein